MENAKSVQKKSTKKFLNKLFTSSSKKNSSSVSPQSEWFPEFTVSDNNVTHHANSPYSHTTNSRHSNEELYQQQSRTTPSTPSGPIRRFSFSNVHETGRQRMLAAKRAEYQEKMQAFDDLIQRRRGSTLRLALTPDVASY